MRKHKLRLTEAQAAKRSARIAKRAAEKENARKYYALRKEKRDAERHSKLLSKLFGWLGRK